MANPSESRDSTAFLTEGEITYMTANKMTRYNLVSRTPPPSYKPRECTQFDSFGKLTGAKEFDMVGVVISADQKVRQLQNVAKWRITDPSYSKRHTNSTKSLVVKIFIWPILRAGY